MEIEKLNFNKAMVIESHCKMWMMPFVMKRGFLALMEHFESNGVTPTLPPFARYKDFDRDELMSQSKFKMFIEIFTRTWHFEVGFPIEREIPETSEIKLRDYGELEVATMLHKGPYHKVGETYTKLYNETKAKGLAVENISFESYLNDPRVTPKDELETMVAIPLSR